MGMFVGHDHNNDYAVAYKEVLLAYGRYTGGNTVYNDLGIPMAHASLFCVKVNVSLIPIFGLLIMK